ncbi:hypothetical protein EV693_102230 [Nicoletella semolina]|uniref:DUF596 domain-containing protein n=1 Tax=Nicoletella semolina TaxID=271160 RepID=A0A4R2NBT9_9PAST|nr:DUF596 domain-containing protein [Nicoletella semolina]MDH2925001.1 hypothetical protein [Nicoletella semolina]TCP18550.1 hypothetical protein EV693_102230 [Nicoletella semolina]
MINRKKRVLDKSIGLSFPHFFSAFQDEFGYIDENPEIKELFLSFMQELIEENKLKLFRNNKFLEGSAMELVEQFRQVWPKEYDENDPEKDIDYMWWWTLAPAGPVWIEEDGTMSWT